MEEQYLYTEDRLLGGSVVLRQPMQGFRAAIDPVLLAAAVPAAAGERVLELGAGTGAAALCLARRVAGVESIGLDIQPDLVALANANALANGLAGSARFMVGDVAHLPAELLAVRFDHVMANPPYLPTGSATLPANAARALAVGERAGAELPVWIDAALRLVSRRGSVTFIHRADRLDALLGALSGRAGGIAVFPLWPRAGEAAKRLLVQARPGLGTPLKLSAGLVLHEKDGVFTEAAEAILRRGGELDIRSPAGLATL